MWSNFNLEPMRKEKIKIVKQETRYILDDRERHSISVVISGDSKHISIYRKRYFNKGFDFIESDKKTVEVIIRLLSEAIKLI